MVEINWNPDDRTLRHFGWLSLGAAVVWTALFARRHGREYPDLAALVESWRVTAPFAAGAVIAMVGTMRPRWLKPVSVGLSVATYPLGWCVSNLLLVLIFGLVFTPLAMIFRLIGRDALARRPDSARDSYWVRRGPPPPASSYFRQS